MEILTNLNAPVRRLMLGLLLPTVMLAVLVGALSGVREAGPGRRLASGPAEARHRPTAADLAERAALGRADRSARSTIDDGAIVATTLPEAPPTTAEEPTTTTAPPTTAPTTVRAAAPAPTTTTTTAPAPTTETTTTTTAPPPPENTQEGEASWYDHQPGVCAHRTLEFGTVVRVTNLANGRSVSCTVGDRGPFVAGRILDLDRQEFSQIASTSEGVIRVRIAW